MLVTENKKSEGLTVEQVIRQARESKVFRRLNARARLSALADEGVPRTEEERELARLKHDYLPQWAMLDRWTKVGKGLPGKSTMVDLMRPTASWELQEPSNDIDPLVCSIINSALDEITPRLPMARAALGVRYMNAMGPAVYRSGRLYSFTQDEIEDLCDAAERLLVPVVKRKHLRLW